MSVFAILAGLILCIQQPGTPAGLGAAPKIKLEALAARDAVAPGESVDVLLQLDIPRPWHMYHPIILDTGMATTFSFKLPPGVTVGDVRFPSPEFGAQSGIRYLEFHGRVSALTTVTLDKAAKAGGSVEIEIGVSGLACVEACVPVETKTTLKLPVKDGGGGPANADVFKAARAKLPPALAETPYLKGSKIEVSKSKVGINDPAELVATLKIEKGHHIQDRDPGVEGLIPTQIFIETPDGIEFAAADKQIWPEPKKREVAGVGQVREHAGEIKIRIPFKVTDAEIKLRSVALRALVYYQVCNDAGVCYPPAFAEQIVRFEIDPAIKGEKAASGTDNDVKGGGAAAATGGGAAGKTYKSISVADFLYVLFGAFLGGVILNIMPCVLPVLSIKILSFMHQAGEDRGRVFAMGLVYAGGILLCFVVLAVIMMMFGVAWGGFMQEPLYVAVLAAIVFAFALSLLGVYEFRLPGAVESAAGSVTGREGYGGAFLNGLMAVALATPCVGPFLGSAVGTLVQLPPLVGGLGIMMVGVGLAFPYVLLTAFPQWLKFLPRPGRWMITFKEVMGFVLVATVLWLLWVLQYQVASLISTLVLLLTVAVACWMLGRLTLSASEAKTYGTYAAGLAVIACGWVGGQRLFGAIDAPPTATVAADAWRAWEPGLPERLAAEGKTVYVDFTAKWCATCQVNKATVLKVNPVRSRLAEMGVVLIEGDFTRRDPVMQEELRKYDRAGVPLNIIYPAGKPEKAIVLPELLTSGIVLDALKQAGPSSTGASAVTLKTP